MVDIKGLIFDNFLLKVVSFLVAAGLWMYVTSRGDIEVNFAIPVELKNVPALMTVENEAPRYVNVRLKGRHSAIRNVNASQIRVALDLADAKAGNNHYTLMEDGVRAPKSVEVVHISPRAVTFRMLRLEQREIVAHAETVGAPAPGYQVAKVVVTPPRVKVVGPEDEVRSIDVLSIPPVRVSGESENFSREVRLEFKQRNVRLLDRQTVLVTVMIKKQR